MQRSGFVVSSGLNQLCRGFQARSRVFESSHPSFTRFSSSQATPARNPSKNLASLLDEQCNKLQHKDALRVPHQHLRWTYNELQTFVDAAANGILGNWYNKGSTIVSALGNETESITMNLAASKVGVKIVNVKPNVDELATALDNAKPQGLMMLFGDKEKESIVNMIPELDSGKFPLRSKRFPFLRQVINTHYHNIVEDAVFYREFHMPQVVPNEANKMYKQIAAEDPVSSFMDNSRDTTMNHSQITDLAYSMGAKAGFNFSERICNTIPLSNPIGLVTVWSSFLHSSFLVLPSSSFDVKATLEAINKEHCTVLVGTPSQISALLDSSADKIRKQNDMSTLKKVVIVQSEGDSQNVDQLSQSLRGFGVKDIFTFSGNEVKNT